MNYCVLIPTYNNAKTLARVIDGVLRYTSHIIIVNDGATDATPDILARYPELSIIHLPKNKGKGNALRIGFDKARNLGYDYALTIDSDGQHYPEDIPVFIATIEAESEPTLLVGSRNMTQDGYLRKVASGINFLTSGFTSKRASIFLIRNQDIGYILCSTFLRNITPKSLSLR